MVLATERRKAWILQRFWGSVMPGDEEKQDLHVFTRGIHRYPGAPEVKQNIQEFSGGADI